MELPILISQIVGIAYISIGLGFFVNSEYYKKELPKMLENSSLIMFGSAISIAVGMLILQLHGTWHDDWTVLISLLGWIALIKGISLLLIPGLTQKMKNHLQKDGVHLTIAGIMLFLGILFTTIGTFPPM